ncbi:adenylate/guanylate cyclase [Caenispirillum salinarum AK4]|uniref:Adenylate/guanylate cyclase n=1 Tax=Caenispirillum salinarum AK4 TaxID=1238182 RepID=K9H2Q4_9PROT|nr:adenylate/guanylate cyclase domain-containing protein [Caenispirillum salinarum]EKV31339.1 adenylate/guanylate cyclase [Caenispirillum salinarum AK4]
MIRAARRVLMEAEIKAERTVAKVRVAVGVALVTGVVALVVGPALEAADDAVLPQIAVAVGSSLAFLVLGVSTWFMVHRGTYRPWMGWVFSTLDVALLTGSLALSLRVTDLPGPWLVVVPALWVAPVILAFGALRYNPWLQAYLTLLLCGVIGLLGTIGLDAALPAGPPGLVEPPPNAMRLVMLVLLGLVLMVVSIRARRLLLRMAEETEHRINLTRYLPRQLAERLADEGVEALKRGARQSAAVMFVDIRGFTARTRGMPPEGVSTFVSAFRARVTAEAEAHGGVVDKFIGDAALIIFGIPDDSTDAARRALSCARGILAEVDSWSQDMAAAGEAPVAVGIGLHHGDVFVGAVGTADRLEFTVLGDTVNVAARLQDECKVQGLSLIASREALAAAGEAPRGWVTVPPHPVRGRDGNLDLYGQKPYAAAS